VKAWNLWRKENHRFRARLGGVNLSGEHFLSADFRDAMLDDANLCGTNLGGSTLRMAYLRSADLSGADLREADLWGADLSGSNLRGAKLDWANLCRAKLVGTSLVEAELSDTNFIGADLNDADFNRAYLFATTFGDNDLSTVRGLETVVHRGPSTIGVDTLFRSNGKISEVFLRGAGAPDEFIAQIPALVASVEPIQFQSCFISYSHQDEEFAKRLHAAMRAENLRVWFAPEDMKAGRKLHEEIFRAIQLHDKLLLVLSEHSMKSEWVMTEIRRAKKVERAEDRRKLFPIRLVDFETIQNWECFDADSGKDLAAEVREYYIPDFSNWKDHDSFEKEFAKLLGALKATER